MKKKTVVPTMSVRGRKIYTKTKKGRLWRLCDVFVFLPFNLMKTRSFIDNFFLLRKAGLKKWD